MVKENITKEDLIYETKKVDFKFKKRGFNRLVIFDLDETLIHCPREPSDPDCEQE